MATSHQGFLTNSTHGLCPVLNTGSHLQGNGRLGEESRTWPTFLSELPSQVSLGGGKDDGAGDSLPVETCHGYVETAVARAWVTDGAPAAASRECLGAWCLLTAAAVVVSVPKHAASSGEHLHVLREAIRALYCALCPPHAVAVNTMLGAPSGTLLSNTHCVWSSLLVKEH